MSSASTHTHHIKEQARALGFTAVGVASILASDLPPKVFHHNSGQTSHTRSLTKQLWNRLTKWLDSHFHGTMTWMERDPERRSNPTKVLPGCKSIIVVGMNYYTNHDPNESRGAGRIARYAWGMDYHDLMQTRLKKLETYLHSQNPEAQTRVYVDTGPIMEKAWAQEAGIGWIGKHTNLVSTSHGSWLLLGEILTTQELQPDEPASDLCESCSLCIQTCPTNAIVEPYILDAERCISYLTIEHRGDFGEIPTERQKQIGNRIFGCDDCLDICPFNNNAHATHESAFQPLPWTLHPQLSKLSMLTQDEFKRITKGSPIRRAKYGGFQRNVQAALQNESSSSSTATQ